MSVEDYFSETRTWLALWSSKNFAKHLIVRIQLVRPQYPEVNVGSKAKPVYLPPEFCEVLQGQGRSAKLDASQTRNMITFANQQGHKSAKMIVSRAVSATGLKSNENPTQVSAYATLALINE